MGRGVSSSRLTKQIVFGKVSQVTIFATYLGIPVDIIKSCIDTGELICNPLRTDKHPTAGFKYNNRGKLKFRDFGNDQFWGDCFDVVALIMRNIYNKEYNVNDKDDFIKILKHITFTFKDIFYGGEKDINMINHINTSISIIKHQKPIIEVVVRQWNTNDENYWNKFGVSLQFLNVNFIYPVDQYYINRYINPEPKYYYHVEDPCYAYYLGRDAYKNNNIKLYFPQRDKKITRFITNCNHLEGIYNLDRNDYNIIIITKSTKDRVSIGANLQRMFLYGQDSAISIGVINIPHETYHLRENEYNWLKSKLTDDGKLVSLMDNDKTGKQESVWFRNNYPIIPIIIPKKYNAKDFAELVSNNDYKVVNNLVKQTIKYIQDYGKNN